MAVEIFRNAGMDLRGSARGQMAANVKSEIDAPVLAITRAALSWVQSAHCRRHEAQWLIRKKTLYVFVFK